MTYILFFIGILCGFLPWLILYCCYIQPRLKLRIDRNEQLIQEEQNARDQLEELREQTKRELQERALSLQDIKAEIIRYQDQKENLLANIEDIRSQAQITADAIYEKSYALMEAAFEQSAERLGEQYQEDAQLYQQEYLAMLQDLAKSFVIELEEKKVEIANAQSTLDDLQSKVWSAVMANKRALEIQEQANFYRLNLSKEDKEEIIRLKSILPYLKDKEALNKVIWKVYYEKPYTDLVGRVIGLKVRPGIYKITNLENQMCYIGQSTNVAERWRQHIKRGLGAETPTRNKLYPALAEFGVENFSFELIEECPVELLDEREDYWQNFYGAKEYGYSIK